MPSASLRRGIRTTQTVNPDSIVPPIDIILKRATPWRSQLTNLLEKIGSGPKPRQKKVRIANYISFDPLDECQLETVGTGGWERYARIVVAQNNVLGSPTEMFYQPGDELLLIDTDQVVEVVATPSKKHDLYPAVPDTLGGATNGFSAPGTVVVRTVKPVPFINATLTQFQYLGHPIREGQDYDTEPLQRDVIYDANFVERIDVSWSATDEETEYIKVYGIPDDFRFQQEEAIYDIKTQRELRCMFGQRSVDFTNPRQPKYNMGGVLDFIRTNVMVYNPDGITNPERLLRTWMTEQLFRYTPNGNEKYVLIGLRALARLTETFDNIRRVDIKTNQQELKAAGLNIQTYEWLGQIIHIIPYQHFRIGTKYEDWVLGLDLPNIELRTAIDFRVKNTTLPNQRRMTFFCEWAGTILVHQEYTHALLRTP
ncbi:MAG: hypothetical protein KatS3mg083_105 [Candidatus Dojkabacteria bacterium]|nr:MAG: hypothetical protein KatS3mg083_105 [Candidatus Dojkabacteria bacterium]